ncbi:MAG TPA: hypothetical protein VGM88_02015 [Kofleriaceae bacterium]|jgi:hypothetical protein
MKRFLGLAIGLVSGLAACGQDEGERCQVQADCAGSLICNLATNTCETSASGDLDAKPPDDSFIIKFDSPPGSESPAPDAAPDAGPDAGADAPPSDI